MCFFSNNDNFAPLYVGQLKTVAGKFYDRLSQFGYNWKGQTSGTATTPYPWSGTVHSQNLAPATTGQIKRAFSFTVSDTFLALDGDNDGQNA